MAKNQSFGLPEKGEFDRANLENKLIGKVVFVIGASGSLNLDGKLVYYKAGNIAVLNPYILNLAGKPYFMNEVAVIEQPSFVGAYTEKTVEELLEKKIKPALRRTKKKK